VASAAYERRNARARAEGYRSDYDRRIHDNGRIPPSLPPLAGEDRSKAAGHRGYAALIQAVSPEDLVTVSGYSRNPKGQYDWVEVTVTAEDGSERVFRLRGYQLTTEYSTGLFNAATQVGAVMSPAPSLDIFNFMDDVDLEVDYDYEEDYEE